MNRRSNGRLGAMIGHCLYRRREFITLLRGDRVSDAEARAGSVTRANGLPDARGYLRACRGD